MKKLMALVLSLGLVLLGTAPVMAAGQAAKMAPTQPEGAVQVVVPGTEELADMDLAKNKGSGPEALVVVVRGAVVGALTSAGGYIAAQKLKGKKVDAKVVAAKAAYGAAIGTINGTLGVAKKTIEYGGKAAKYAYEGLKWTYRAASAGIGYLWNKATGSKR